MDLLAFECGELYFDETLEPAVEALIGEAARSYADGGGEPPLLQAREAAPNSLTVLVALYRFYYYRRRLEDAWRIAAAALAMAGGRLGLPRDWRSLDAEHIGRAALHSMTLLRFYLFALKAAAYLRLRLGDTSAGVEMLEKLTELDERDRLGAAALLRVVRETQAPAE